jgi:DNA-binding transcriptional ArsR family regulator
MPNYDFTPLTMMALTADDKIRAYVHPVRMKILEMLGREKQSVSGVARFFGVRPANLTHHFKILAKADLIRLVEKRDTGKNLEKFYRAVAYHFTASPGGEPPADKNLLALSLLHDDLTAALQRLRDRGQADAVFGMLKTLRLLPKDVAPFQQRLARLMDEFTAHRLEDGAPYTVNLSVYPGVAEPPEGNGIVIRGEDDR